MLTMNWKNVIGMQEVKPAATDTTSSPTTAYIRRNIKRVLIQQGAASYYAWQYEEVALSLAEYAEYEELVAQLETPAIQALKEKNEILAAGLADIYERLENQETTSTAIMSGLADLYELQEGAAQ